MEKLTVGSLFSGIGGIELGLERTGGFRTIWNCEVDEYASAVLKKHWPGVPNLGDITKVDWSTVERPDLICGGFPCQDISNAGKKAGITGKRSGLWKEFHRAITGARPDWVIIENVGALTSRGLDVVLEDLRSAGYQAFRPVLIEAASVGAPHHRERLFIVAHADGCGYAPGLGDEDAKGRESEFGCRKDGSLDKLVADGRVAQELADAHGERREEQRGAIAASKAQPAIERARENVSYSESISIRAGLRAAQSQGKRGGRLIYGSWWAVEPGVGRVAHGVPNRVDRIKCLGNAVVPQVAQVIGEAILEIL